MRYIAIDDSLVLLAASGKPKYEFKNGVLQVGTPTGTGAGNEIVPDLAGTDLDSKMATLYPTAGTDLGKVGEAKLFFQAPPIVAAGTLTSGEYYELIAGTADLTNAAYVGKYTLVSPASMPTASLKFVSGGIVIKATANITVPAGSATWAKSLPISEYDPKHLDERAEHFQLNNLSAFKDESVYSPANYGPKTVDAATDPYYTR
jgi:hypothetical protein